MKFSKNMMMPSISVTINHFHKIRQLVSVHRSYDLPQLLDKPTNQNSNLHAAHISDSAQFPVLNPPTI